LSLETSENLQLA